MLILQEIHQENNFLYYLLQYFLKTMDLDVMYTL